ncbi:DUF2160 domain-containing protein [Halomonadaceae bacterium KBTZ08]
MLAWMNWTPSVAIFFIVIAAILATMTVYEIISPSIERKGFLPIPTTRGDRLFIGLLSAAYIHLAFLALTDITLWVALVVAIVWQLVLFRWG